METILAVCLALGWLNAKWINTESKRTQSQHFNIPHYFALWEPLFWYLCIYLAAPGLSCSMQDLVPWPGAELGPLELGAWRLSHWTSREVPLGTSLLSGPTRWSRHLLYFPCSNPRSSSLFKDPWLLLLEHGVGNQAANAGPQYCVFSREFLPLRCHCFQVLRWDKLGNTCVCINPRTYVHTSFFFFNLFGCVRSWLCWRIFRRDAFWFPSCDVQARELRCPGSRARGFQ